MREQQHEKRKEVRVRATMPVTLEKAGGMTCDVSASGVLFLTSAALAAGEAIDFKVEFDTPAGKRVLKCWGNIVRTEARDDRLGVAVKIHESTMEVGVTWRAAEAASK